jgi:hypothetical protein
MLQLTIRTGSAEGFPLHGLTEVQTWTDLSGSVCAYGYVGPGADWIRWPGFVAFRFDQHGTFEAFPEGPADPRRILDLSRRVVEPLVLQALGWETLHASAVRTPAGIVAFCGERETGKSTIAYSLSRRGYPQHSDDSVVLQVTSRGITGLRLPFGVRLRREAASFFGFEADARQLQDVVPITAADGDRMSTEPLSALFVLRRVQDAEPVVERLTSAGALTALLAHAHCFNPKDAGSRRRLLENYLEMAAAVPVYELRFGAGLDRLPSVLACVERTVNDAAMARTVCCA